MLKIIDFSLNLTSGHFKLLVMERCGNRGEGTSDFTTVNIFEMNLLFMKFILITGCQSYNRIIHDNRI